MTLGWIGVLETSRFVARIKGNKNIIKSKTMLERVTCFFMEDYMLENL